MQHFKFENWRIRGFDFWCHEQVNYYLVLFWRNKHKQRIHQSRILNLRIFLTNGITISFSSAQTEKKFVEKIEIRSLDDLIAQSNCSYYSSLSGQSDIYLGSVTLQKKGPKYQLQKQGHCYSRKEAAWPLLFWYNNDPVFCNP